MTFPTPPAGSGTRPPILVVSTNADRAGAPVHVRDLVLALKDRYRFVVVFGEDGPIRDSLNQAGVETHVIDNMRSEISPLKDVGVVKALRAHIRRVNPALIHLHSSKASLVGRFAGHLEGVPVVYTIHGWGFGEGRPRLRSLLVQASEYLTRGYVSSYLAVSEADARIGQAALGISGTRMRVIHNGVGDVDGPERARPGADGGFVMVARTGQQKDHQTALRAFGQVQSSMRFTCIGGGTDDPAFAQQARNWAGPAAPRVDLLGSRPDIPALLAASSIFVLCSLFEGLPIAIIEAMRAGLPVIATDCGGVSELVVDGETGRLVAPGDIAGAARAMQELAASPDLRERFGVAGRMRYEQMFSLPQMSAKLASAYDDLVGARREAVAA